MSRKNRVLAVSAAALLGAAVFFYYESSDKHAGEKVRTIHAQIDRTPQPDIMTMAHQDVLNVGQAAPIAAKSVKVLLSERAEAQLQMLHEILNSKNDNDPRLDSELKVLDEDLRKQMRAEYKAIRREKLNERGTVVFLLGRNLKTQEDFEFLNDVFSEPRCLSLENCSKESLVRDGERTHTSSVDAITLAYPQFNALLALEKVLKSKDASSDEKAWAEKVLSAARNSPVPEIASRADRVLAHLRTSSSQ